MNCWVDTSALYALLDGSDRCHAAATGFWRQVLAEPSRLSCSNYVLLECSALVTSRLGLPALADFQAHIRPWLQVEWIGAEAHAAAMDALLMAGRRDVSLVDCVSFQCMRRLGLTAAFTFDRHFAAQGFRCHPKSGAS